MPTMIHSYGCKQEAYQVCLACGSKVCACHGLARGQCPVCLTGFLTNYYKIGTKCGYAGCNEPAVMAVPRVKQACAAHGAKHAHKHWGEPDGKGRPTARTQIVLRALGREEQS